MASTAKPALHVVEKADGIPPCPKNQQLIVTTCTGVFSWDNNGITMLFRSGSGGIIAARKANNMLAVADGRVVILHDLSKGLQKRSYRLKPSAGQVGSLQYIDDPTRLYFTTTLQNAVQIFSLKTAELLDATHSHPSPPNVFAVSPSSHLLLSASSHPPLTYLSSIQQHSQPLLLHARCSSSAVVAAAFHPQRPNIFALAYGDGTVAVYDTLRLRLSLEEARAFDDLGTELDPEVGYITKVHATVSQARSTTCEGSDSVSHHGLDPHTGTVGIGATSRGITGIAFVSGLKATVMSVGADGRCCVVDFAVSKRQINSGRIRKVRSWHLGSAATSLTILCVGAHAPSSSVEGRGISRRLSSDRALAAIGLESGKVLVYDIEGKLEGQHSFHQSDRYQGVVGLEWARADDCFEKGRRQSSLRVRRKNLDSLLGGRPGLIPAISTIEPAVVSHPATIQPTLEHMDLRSPVSTTASDSTEYQTAKEDLNSSTSLVRPTMDTDKERKRRGILGADGLNEQSSQSTIVKSAQTPSIPPRPTPKPGGRLYLRRAQTSSTSVIGTHHAGPSKHSKSLGVMRNTANKRGSRILSPSNEYSTLPQRATAGAFSSNSDEGWTDLDPEAPTAETKVSPNTETLRGAMTPAASRPSEGSNDTIVDWSANTPLQPAPTMNITRTTTIAVESSAKRPPPDKHTPASSDPNPSSKSNDTVVQWSSLKKSPRILDLHNDLEVGTRPTTGPSGAISPPPLPDRAVRNPLPVPLHNPNADAAQAPNLPPRTVPFHAPLPSRSAPLPYLATPQEQSQPGEHYQDPHDLARILQASLHRELKLFHREIMAQFDMQKAWFRHETRDKDLWIQKLEDENGRLRHELSRVRRR